MHHWQDYTLAAVFVVLNISLIPSIRSKSKPALATSLIAVGGLIAGLIVYLSLSLWFASAMTVINICLWSTLAIQRLKQK